MRYSRTFYGKIEIFFETACYGKIETFFETAC
jgi:hypothetical protein